MLSWKRASITFFFRLPIREYLRNFRKSFVTPHVIPAQAGIQSKHASEGHGNFMLSASHSLFKLDSGLRRNDGEVGMTVK
ncbi:MAG TPA: hypothetical protein VL997_16930 [Dyella sp.]|nr:hypothetical protein [Dyella sp.]